MTITATAPTVYSVDAFQLVEALRCDIQTAVFKSVDDYFRATSFEVEEVDEPTYFKYRDLIAEIMFDLIEHNLNSIAETAELPTSREIAV